jgi:adenylate cyclase
MMLEWPVRVERKLSAIFAADAAGYSPLTHREEDHAKLAAPSKGAVQPAIAEHGGRIVKHTGDGFLAEFSSAVEAVRTAIQFQTRIGDLAIGEPACRFPFSHRTYRPAHGLVGNNDQWATSIGCLEEEIKP